LTRRIGLLGGTFDPIHFGHIQLAELALKRCDLFEVMFIPAANPPHKLCHDVTDFEHRVTMMKIALAGKRGFRLSELEAELPTPSYTIDTLTFLKKNQKKGDEFYFIIGEDAFLELDSWKSYEGLLSLTHFIVSGRSGFSAEYFQSFAQSLGYSSNGKVWFDPSRKNEIIFLPTETDDISSTLVRDNIRYNVSIHGLVPEEVIRYIQRYRLYS